VTGHRFEGLADSSAKQSRVQRLGEKPAPLLAFDGDKSPAQKRGQVRALQNGCDFAALRTEGRLGVARPVF